MFRRGLQFTFAIALATTAAFSGVTEDVAQAKQLYDQGRYDEARPILERAVNAGAQDGGTLYRLYYTQLIAEDPAARATLRTALAQLEKESSEGGDLETAFYLSNAYGNLGKLSDRARVAAAYTDGMAPDRAKPESGVDRFRIAKLYEDQEKNDLAEEWYRAAVDKLTEEGDSVEAYLTRARSFIAEQENSRGNRDGAAEQYNAMLGGGAQAQQQMEQLALDLARQGRYSDAAKTWNKALLKNPNTGDRARYAGRVASLANELAPLPTTDKNGSPLSTMSQIDLETLMKNLAQTVREVQIEAQDGKKRNREELAALQARLDETKPLFIAAAMEFILQGYPLRETAFQAGYAPLIFRGADWAASNKRQERRPRAKGKNRPIYGNSKKN